MLYKIDKFKNMHAGEFILVCGLGKSLNSITQQFLEDNKIITIGCNDINRFLKTTYCYYQDNWSATRQYSPETAELKIETIKNFTSDYLFISNGAVDQIYNDFSSEKNIVQFYPEFYRNGSRRHLRHFMRCNFDYQILFRTKFPTSLSIFGAVCLAYYMGSRNIGIIGFDMSPIDATDNNNIIFALNKRTAELAEDNKKFADIFFQKFTKAKIFNFSNISQVFKHFYTLENMITINNRCMNATNRSNITE